MPDITAFPVNFTALVNSIQLRIPRQLWGRNHNEKIWVDYRFVQHCRIAMTSNMQPNTQRPRITNLLRGPSIYDVRNILGFFDPPLSAFGTDLQY